MTLFSDDAAAIFDDVLGVDAIYTPEGGDPVALRVIPSRPDAAVSFGQRSFVAETATFLVLVEDVADLCEGDALRVGSDDFVVQGAPRRDDRQVYWIVEARPA